MKRLTTDKNASEMSMIELAHNSCYADKERRARYRDYELDIDARDLAKMLINDMCNEDLSSMTDEEFDNYIKEMLADGMNSQIGLIALFYRNVWAMADLREKLADYENTGMTPEQVIEMQMDWVAMKATHPKWIPVTERLPEEHDSIFAKLKVTEEWKKGMYTKVSDNVLVTIKHEDCGLGILQVAKTTDGKWKNDFLRAFSSAKVIAWMPFPEPYKE